MKFSENQFTANFLEIWQNKRRNLANVKWFLLNSMKEDEQRKMAMKIALHCIVERVQITSARERKSGQERERENERAKKWKESLTAGSVCCWTRWRLIMKFIRVISIVESSCAHAMFVHCCMHYEFVWTERMREKKKIKKRRKEKKTKNENARTTMRMKENAISLWMTNNT